MGFPRQEYWSGLIWHLVGPAAGEDWEQEERIEHNLVTKQQGPVYWLSEGNDAADDGMRTGQLGSRYVREKEEPRRVQTSSSETGWWWRHSLK